MDSDIKKEVDYILGMLQTRIARSPQIDAEVKRYVVIFTFSWPGGIRTKKSVSFEALSWGTNTADSIAQDVNEWYLKQ